MCERPWLLPCLEDLDGIALGERDDRALLVGALADGPAAALELALAPERVHRRDAHVPDRLDGLLDLGLVRPGIDQEGVAVQLEPGVGLLRHHRADDHVAWRLHASSPPSVSSAVSAAPSSAAASGSVSVFACALGWADPASVEPSVDPSRAS